MAKQLNVNLNINADSKQAKAVFQDLQQTLTKLQGTIATNPKNMFNVQEIKAASAAAKELQQHLLEATDVNTGRLNLATFSQSLKSSGKDLASYKTQLESMGPVGEQAFMKVAKSIALAENPIRRTNTLLAEFKTTLVNTARWQISSSILHGFIGAIRGAYGYAQDLNESLNNIRIVTGYNVDKMADFAEEANKAAKALSTTTTAYTDAALIYYQQGLGDKAVKERTDVTVKMANVSRQSAEEVSNQMTAIWNNFDDGSKKLEYYADVITALGAATASSSEEIATGLEKFSAVAETVGLSYEYATSALATITATTRQSADVVGTALKTLFARIQDLELGETLEDGTTLGKYSAALKVVGIDIKDINDEVKDMDTILDELGAKWNTIAKDEQIALAQTVAGTRQYAQLMALMNNWDFMKENLQTVSQSEGTLQKQADIYAESWEASSKRVKASLETIYSELLNDKFFIALNNGFAGLLDGISGFVKGMGGLQGVLSTIGAFITQSLAKEAPVALERIKESILQIAGVSQRQGAEMQNQLSQWLQSEQKVALTGVQEGTGSAEYLAQVNTLDILAQKRREYNQLESQYNSSQKAEAQQTLAVLEAQGQAYESTGKQIDRTNANLETMRQRMLEVVNTSSRSNASLALFNVQDIAKAQGSLQGLQAQLLNLKDTYKDKSPEEYSEQLEKLANRASDIDQVLPNSTGAIKNLAEQFKEGGLSVDEFAEKLGGELKNSIDSANGPLEAIRENLIETYGVPRGTIEQFIQTQKDAGVSTEDIITKLQNFKSTIGQLPQPITTTSTQLMSFASGLMQVNAAINSITRISEVFRDDDATAIQKISAVIGGLTTAMFLFNAVNKLTTNVLNAQNKSLFGNLGAWLRSRVAKTADTTATIANTGAEGANTGAKIAGKAASDALNVSLGTTLALMGPIIAILAAVVIAIYAVIKAIEKAKENSPEGQLKKTKKALDEVKESYDELKDSLTDIQDQQDALKELERGTLEWNEAVQKLNQSILEVLETYPQLAGAVKNINGYLELDTNSQVYKDFLQQQLREYEHALQEYQQAQIRVNNQNKDQALNSIGKELRRSGVDKNSDDYKAIMELAESGKLTSEKLADYFSKDSENGTTLAQHASAIEALVQEIVGYESSNNLLEEQLFQSSLRAANIDSYNNLDSTGQSIIAKNLQSDRNFKGEFSDQEKEDFLNRYIQQNLESFKNANTNYYDIAGRSISEESIIPDEVGSWLKNTIGMSLNEIADALNLSFDEIAMSIGEDVAIDPTKVNQKIKEYLDLLAKVPEGFQEAIKTQDFSKLSKEQLEELKATFKVMSKTSGDNWALTLNTTAGQFFEAINQAIQKQVDQIKSGENLAEIQGGIATDNKNVSSLNFGDTIDGEKYHELSDGLKSYFKEMEDGTYKLMDEASELKQALFSIHLKDALTGLEDFLSTTSNRYSLGENSERSLVGMDISQLNAFTPEQEAIAQDWGNTIALLSTNLGELNAATTQLNTILPDAAMVAEAERQGLMDLATQYENCKEELNALQRAYQENNEQAKQNAATNLELAISAAEQAAANGLEASTIEALTKTFKSENDELAKNANSLRSTAEAASDAAVRHNRLNNGISDLYSNFKKYDTVLSDISKATTAAEKATIAFSKDGIALRETLADILDTSADFMDADFLAGIDSDTLEQAAMGSEEAINRIRDAFIDAQAAAAGLADSPELQDFKNMLDDLAEGAVIDLDTDSFLYKLIEAQLAAGATAEDIQAMLSGFGIDADVEPFEQAMADAADVAAQAAVSVTESGDAIIAGGSINAETNTVTAGASDTQENVGFDEDVTITTVHGQGRVLQAGSGGGNYSNSASLYGVTDAAVVAAAASNDRTVPVDVYYPVARKTVTPRNVKESADKTQSATAIKLSNIHKSAGGKVSTKNRTTTSPRSSGGGGGGGGGSAPKHSARTSSGGIHRYSRSENTVSSLSKQIDRLGKARENAWGLKTLNVMDQEVDKLGKLKEAYEGYIKEVAGTNWKSLHDKIQKGIALTQEDLLGSGGYLKKDLEAILNGRQISLQTEDENGNQQVKNIQRAGIANILGAYGISGLEFDDLGRINNIDEINDAIDKAQEVWIDSWWNAFDATQQEDVANKNELARRTAILDDLKESISLYNDETIQKLIELSDENQDLIYQIQDFHADILNSKLEFNVSLSENNIKRLETAMKILGDNFYKTAEVMSMIYSGNGNDQYQNYVNQGHSYMNYYEDLKSRFQLWQEDNNNPEGIDLAHFIEGAQKVQDGLYETIDNLISINEQMKEYYGNTLARAREELEKLTSQMEHHVNIMEHLKNMMSLLNKETDYDTLEKIIRSQMAMRKNAFDVSTKWHKEALADQLAAEEEYNKLIAAGQEENARVYKEAVLDKAIERTREAEEQMYADAEAYLESVNELYTNTINQIMAKHEKFLTDGFGWDFLSESISKASSIQDEYLTKTNQIYETNVLLRKLAQDIDKTDNTAAKSKLKNFSDEIVAMQQQERLSKNDLEIAKARYEVLQAEIALTDAQNAKSTVRLQRDNEGNYGYVYTADQAAIDDAQQNYADKQNDLYNLVLEQTNTYGQKLIELEKERDAEIAALAEEYRGAEGEKYQEYLQKKADLIQKYNDLFYTYEDSYNKGIMWLNRTAATDYSEAWITEYENVINKSRDYKNEIITEFDEVEAEMRDYHENTKPILEETAIGLGDIDKKTQDVLDANTNLANQITMNGGLIDALEGEIREVEDATRVWAEHYEEIMDNIRALQDYAMMVQGDVNGTQGDLSVDYTRKMITALQNHEYEWDSDEMKQDMNLRQWKIKTTGMKPDWNNGEEYNRALTFYLNEGLKGYLEPALDELAHEVGEDSAKSLISKYTYREFLKKFNREPKFEIAPYDTGGFTGEWTGGGKLALLHQKELVLNAVDTANLLTTVQMVRELASAIDLRAAAANYSSGLSSSTLGFGGGIVEQEVTIHAEFPNVVNHTEIEDAFTNLINRASQFANRR